MVTVRSLSTLSPSSYVIKLLIGYASVSELYKRRQVLERMLKEMEKRHGVMPRNVEGLSPTAFVSSYLNENQDNILQLRHRTLPSEDFKDADGNVSGITSLVAAIKSGIPLQSNDKLCLRRIIESEIEAIQEELNANCTDSTKQYPLNLNLKNFAQYILFPTVVYELEYPRQDHINWYYVAEKGAATFGIIVVMNIISQTYIYPVVVSTVRMTGAGMSVGDRLKELPWVIIDLLLPLMLEHLLAWYVVWDCVVSPPFHTPGSASVERVSAHETTAQPLGRVDVLCRPRVLLLVVEQYLLRSIRA